MIETIHIFDEFSQAPGDLTTEERHTKRMSLDPLIYDILKTKYFAKLQEFWRNHTVPTHSDSTIVLIERRIHPNLAFLLYNAAYFARDFSIVIVCSDVNYEYCKQICGNKAVDIRPLFQGNPEPHVGKLAYNNLQKQKDFYVSLPGEHLLLLEVDCYLRKPIPEEWKQYDLIAAPYEWDEAQVGGGFSYRNKQAMIQITEQYKDDVWAGDTYTYNGMRALGFRIPPFDVGITYVAESCIYEDPIGVHQWWTFFFPNNLPDAEMYFKELMTLQA